VRTAAKVRAEAPAEAIQAVERGEISVSRAAAHASKRAPQRHGPQRAMAWDKCASALKTLIRLPAADEVVAGVTTSKARLSKIDRAACLEPCDSEGGNLVGRDPRQMGTGDLAAAGFERMSPMEVIRAKCLDCCAGSSQEVRYCVATDCPNWAYRTGVNPFRAPPSEARIAAARAMGAKRAAGARD
jgi:hypothetical protein